MSSYRQILGETAAVQTAVPPTYSPDQLKDITAWTTITTPWKRDKGYFEGPNSNYMPGKDGYWAAPWNWVDIPRNYLEKDAPTVWSEHRWRNWRNNKIGFSWVTDHRLSWDGRAFQFKDPQRYLNGLQIITSPLAYVRYLRLAPLAGFNIGKVSMPANTARRYHFDPGKAMKLPREATEDWFREVVTFHLLKMSFALLKMAKIEDETDLAAAYRASENIIREIQSEMLSPVPVHVMPNPSLYKDTQKGFGVSLEFEQWQIDALMKVLKEVRGLIDESRKKMAARVIELTDIDAKIVSTSFSTDPLSNPYLTFNEARSQEEGRPIFTNIARNSSLAWAPPEVAGAPENMKYWDQVADFEKEHERVYATDWGPMSESDLRNYGLDGLPKRTNWLPWIVAGAAAAYAASELL